MATEDPEKEQLEKEILSREIKFFQPFMPDVFFYANGMEMVNTCVSYFSALRVGYPLWAV